MKIPEIKQRLGELDIDVNDVVVIGSGILDALGIRVSRDLDVLVSEAKFREIADGVKFMSLEEVRAWKLRQNRPKDQIDVQLIDTYIAANK